MPEKILLNDVVYHPTFNCNLSCRGCVNYSNHLETRNIPDEVHWDRDLDILFDRFEVAHIEIAGGETLMYPHLPKLIKKLAPAKKYTLTTNGLLLHKNKWLKEVIDTDPKLLVSISVHYDPKIDSKYITNLCNSIAEFLNIPADEVKRFLCKHSITQKYDRIAIYNRIGIRFTYNSGIEWKYPLLDEHELPVRFNNSKEDAFKKCLCPTPHIKDGKIYKCPMTAMLLKVVESKNLYNSSWQFLRDYVPYDLLSDHNADSWSQIHAPEDVCSRCPVSDLQWDRTKTDLHSKII